VVKYFEVNRFDQRIKLYILVKVDRFDDFHSDRIVRSRTNPSWRIFVDHQSSKIDVQSWQKRGPVPERRSRTLSRSWVTRKFMSEMPVWFASHNLEKGIPTFKISNCTAGDSESIANTACQVKFGRRCLSRRFVHGVLRPCDVALHSKDSDKYSRYSWLYNMILIAQIGNFQDCILLTIYPFSLIRSLLESWSRMVPERATNGESTKLQIVREVFRIISRGYNQSESAQWLEYGSHCGSAIKFSDISQIKQSASRGSDIR
jgi:hypothetical protein